VDARFVERLVGIGEDVGVAEPGHGHGPHLTPGEAALLPSRHRRQPRRLAVPGEHRGVGRRRGLLGLKRAPAEVPDVLAVLGAHLLCHGPVEPAVNASEPSGAAPPPAEYLLPRERLGRGLHLRRRWVAGRDSRVWGLRFRRLGNGWRRRRGVGIS
jgi:hypothetical protein